MIFNLITTDTFSKFPSGVVNKAIDKGIIEIKIHNLLDTNKVIYKKPYGGVPGMILEPLSVIKCIDNIKKMSKMKIIILTPSGKLFNNNMAKELSDNEQIIFVSSKFEGIDKRVKEVYKDIMEEISIGDFILSNGDIASYVMIDAISRHIPNVLGNDNSIEENRDVKLPLYTKPKSFVYNDKEYKVPEVLYSGNHKKIKDTYSI